MDYLYQYGLFLAQVATVAVAVMVVVSALTAASARGRRDGSGHIELRRLNEQFESLRDLTEETLLSNSELKKIRKARKRVKKGNDPRPRVFVLKFEGDLEATATEGLRQLVNGILSASENNDEVVVQLFSTGGVVHGYGFAASQLARLKDGGLRVVVAVDQVAASGGYLMACIADELIAAPFALLGSIGVVVQMPNVNRLLKRYAVDVEVLTAGDHKRTLTLLGHNTEQGRQKLQEEIEDVHQLFKSFVLQHRPQLDLERVSTGEAWYGTRALELKLVDRLMTSDEYLQGKLADADLLELNWVTRKRAVDSLLDRLPGIRQFLSLLTKWNRRIT